MNRNFLTIYEVADTLGLHHKTVRGFISSGQLKAMKVGKQWRITREDLDIFIKKDSSFAQEPDAETLQINLDNSEVQYSNNPIHESQMESRIRISAVVDIQAVNKNKFERMSNTLLAVMNSKDVKLENATIHLKYDEAVMVCKVFLWGSVDYINEMLSIITLLEEDRTDDAIV